MDKIPKKTIQRLIIYRKILNSLIYEGVTNIYSRKLAKMAGCSPEQVRRDLMVIGYSGSPVHGYNVSELEYSIGYLLDQPMGVRLAVVGLGDLGYALLNYCYWQYPNLSTLAAFDENAENRNKVSDICPAYGIDKIKEIVRKESIDLAILTVSSENVQQYADILIESGIKAILNYTPIHIDMPQNVYVEDLDLMLAVDKSAYFAGENDK